MTSYEEVNDMYPNLIRLELCLVAISKCYDIVDLWILKDPTHLIWEQEYSIDLNGELYLKL